MQRYDAPSMALLICDGEKLRGGLTGTEWRAQLKMQFRPEEKK